MDFLKRNIGNLLPKLGLKYRFWHCKWGIFFTEI